MNNTGLICFLLLLSLNAYAQNVNVRDYQVPVSQAKTLRLDGNWDWSQRGDSVLSNSAAALLYYRTFYSSLPLAWFINVDATGGRQFGSLSHNVSFDGSFFKYIWPQLDWFSFARLTASHANTYRQIASDLTSGFGYGRYIDATALAKAVRIEDHLLNDKIIRDHLPKETILNVAYIIEREDEYQDRYGDVYELNWLEDIAEEIEKSGVLIEDNMSALGTIRMRQVLFSINERVNDRYYGWDARLGVLFPMTTFDKSTPGNPNLIISGQYAYPLSWKIQLNSRAEIFSPMDSTFIENVNYRVGLDFIYELSNRVNLLLRSALTGRTIPDDKAEVNTELDLSFSYYLENKIYLTISSGVSKPATGRASLFNKIGIQYNLF